MKKVVIIGAGGHAKVIAETILLHDDIELLGFADDNLGQGTVVFENYSVVSSIRELDNWRHRIDVLALGIGNITIRQKIVDQLSADFHWLTVIHPTAVIARNAILNEGITILAQTVIASEVNMGAFTIVDAGTIVDHECQIGSFCHLAIGSLIGSNSHISEATKTEIGQIFPSFSKI